jgi:uncharacterized protein (DUF2461 family)
MATTKTASFSPELFSFLADLRANNNRDWFAANKDRYEDHLLEPALAFIEDFAPLLEKISPHFRADPRPSGGSLFRIYRDTRFSKDKSPYKANVGIHFKHERAKDTSAPGYYLHIGPDESSPAAASGTRAPRRRPAFARRSSKNPSAGGQRPAAVRSRSVSSSAGNRSSVYRRGPTPRIRSRTTSGGRTSSRRPA